MGRPEPKTPPPPPPEMASHTQSNWLDRALVLTIAIMILGIGALSIFTMAAEAMDLMCECGEETKR